MIKSIKPETIKTNTIKQLTKAVSTATESRNSVGSDMSSITLKSYIAPQIKPVNISEMWFDKKLKFLDELNSINGKVANNYRAEIIQGINLDKCNLFYQSKLRKTIQGINKEDAKTLYSDYNIDVNNMLTKLDNSLNRKFEVALPAKALRKDMWKNVLANKPETEEFFKNFDYSEFEKTGLPLKYSRAELVTDIDKRIGHLSKNEQNTILGYYGIERGEKGFDGLLHTNGNDTYGIKELIQKYTLENETTFKDEKTNKIFNSLVKGMPAFVEMVGKVQHSTHNYTSDIHTLKVLQNAMKNPAYNKLSNQDKTILKYSILLHDTGKRGGIIDAGHEYASAIYAKTILESENIPQTSKERIVEIIKNHDWFKDYCTGVSSPKDVINKCLCPQDLEIMKIMSKADIMSIHPMFHFNRTQTKTMEEFNNYLADKYKPLDDLIKLSF